MTGASRSDNQEDWVSGGHEQFETPTRIVSGACPSNGGATGATPYDSEATGPLAGTGAGRTARKADTGAGFHQATRPTSSGASSSRVIICGSRDWIDRELIGAVIEEHRAEHGDALVIVHGACGRGADRIAEEIAHDLGVATEAHPADWQQHGKSAGHIRNEEMARAGAVKVEAFWDGKSRGTWGMVEAAKRHGLHYTIHFGKPGGASLAA